MEEQPSKVFLGPDLPGILLKFHLGFMSVGLLTIVLGGASIGYYEAYDFMDVVLAGGASLLAALCALLANKMNSLVLHAGSIATSAVALWFGYFSTPTCIVRAQVYYLDHTKLPALVVCDLLTLLVVMMMAALSLGVQTSVLWVSSKYRKEVRRREWDEQQLE
ncbi:hypothetical protein Pcinc_037533 [Petrolisthes cinctipes]|uniref:Uncharacterized protein n=1 Tax=Petrolisthes cinctipes TaxID=88211 RepID=A0AAE1EMH1_PETCI|nr:hypothetical protein Pcinc_037533 [Petrolisthes cinctipes]